MYNKLFLVLLVCVGVHLEINASVQDFYWRDYNYGSGVALHDAYEAASGRYIGQFFFNNSLLVATIYPYTNTAVGELFGYKYEKHNIKVLCITKPAKFYWERVNFNRASEKQMQNAVVGGYGADIRSELYIGKNMQEGEWKVGKVIEVTHPSKGLWVWDWHGNPSRQFEFDILKYNSTGSGY